MSSVNAPNMHSFPPQHLMEFNNNDFLLTQIKNQVEFYFAPQNLQHDRFLQSHLSATDHLGAVSIHVICSFPKIRQLYSYSRSAYYPHDVDMPADPALLRMALATSSVVSLSHDGMWVVPNVQKDAHKDTATEATVASVPSSPSSSQEGSTHQDRNTVVLNNIADTVTETTILEAFAKFNPKGARPEPDSNTWHVFFGSAEDAAASLEAEIKVNDTLVVGSLKVGMPTVPNLPLPPPAQPTPMMVNGNVMGYHVQYPMHPPPQYSYFPMHYGIPQMVPQQPYTMQPQYYPQPQYRYFAPPGQQRQGVPPPKNVFVRPNTSNNNNNNDRNYQGNRRKNNGNKRKGVRRQPQQQQQQHNQQGQDKPSDRHNGRKQTDDDKKQGKKNETKQVAAPKNLDFSQEHFPSLGGKETPTPATTNVQGSGYAQALLKSTKKETTKEVEDAMKNITVSSETEQN